MLAFAVPVLSFTVTGGDFTGSLQPGRPSGDRIETTGGPPPHLASSSTRSEPSGATTPLRARALPLVRFILLGAPPPTSPRPSTPGVSLPSHLRTVGCQLTVRVPSSWFLTTSTVFSEPRFPACCSRSRTWGPPGFTRVDRLPPERGSGSRPGFPPAPPPFEGFPSSTAARIATSSVPSCRSSPPTSEDVGRFTPPLPEDREATTPQDRSVHITPGISSRSAAHPATSGCPGASERAARHPSPGFPDNRCDVRTERWPAVTRDHPLAGPPPRD